MNKFVNLKLINAKLIKSKVYKLINISFKKINNDI